jgi:hypothetical protein
VKIAICGTLSVYRFPLPRSSYLGQDIFIMFFTYALNDNINMLACLMAVVCKMGRQGSGSCPNVSFVISCIGPLGSTDEGVSFIGWY